MNFMGDDEYLLLMVHCEGRAIGFEAQHILTIAERARLRGVGIQTAHEQPAWALLEPSQGNYDFSYLENIINRNREAGLKSLIQLAGWRIPDWMPVNWMAMQQNGTFERDMLSIWNEEAQQYSDDFYKLIINKYASPDVGFFFGEFQGGEGALPPSHCFYDAAALEHYKNIYGNSAIPDLDTPETTEWFKDSVIRHFMRKGKIFYDYNKEIWNAQQYLMNRWNKSYGNYAQPYILRSYREAFPDANIVLLQYTYFDDSHDQQDVEWVDMLREISKCEVIVEAMFCSGLPSTTPKAILKGFRGQIVHPVNEIGKTQLEEWEVDNIRASHNLWKEKINEDSGTDSNTE